MTERLGFKHRKRLYDDKGTYLYTAIPARDGVYLVPTNKMPRDAKAFKLTINEYFDFIAKEKLEEVGV